MIRKELDAITKDDIDALVANAVSEGRDIEYKEELPRGSDEGTKEFLADVASFANAGGGDLIYGIREQRDANGTATGIPQAVEGLLGCNPDADSLRLLSKIREGIEPRIPRLLTKHIPDFPRGPVLILCIFKSWLSPHMVKFKHSSRFFSRNSAGKYQLDVTEIKSAFLASETVSERISAFRSDRVGKILTGETPMPLVESVPKIILHLLPIQSFSEPNAVDLNAAYSAWSRNQNQPEPMGRPRNFGPPQFNFSGLVLSGTGSTSANISYLQLFRNGSIEAVCAAIGGPNVLIGAAFEQELMRGGRSYINFQKLLGFGPPLYTAISLVPARGCIILPRDPPPPFAHWDFVSKIDRDALLAPEVLIEEGEFDFGKVLRPALDTLWQASGWPGSQGYGESGKWEGYLKYAAA